jgi:CBS domain-containing membrane protein
MTSRLFRLVRSAHPIRPLDAARAGLGALLGLAMIGVILKFAVSAVGLHAWFVPAIGSSAVLVFALPASPLAQPRAVIGGNVVAALVGVACAALIPEPVASAAIAVAVSVVAMSLIGCLHPPGGAVALSAAAATSAGAAGLAYVAPVAVCSALLVLAAMAIINLMGRSYPHRVAAPVNAHHTRDENPATRVGFTADDLDRALSKYGELLDVSRDDLDALFRQVELEAHSRLHAQIKCEDIMSRDVLTVDATQSAPGALAFLRKHDLRTAPVIDEEHRVVGIVRRAELVAAGRQLVGAVLDPFAHKVRPGTAIESLLPLLSSGECHEVMVVDENRRLVGLITQTDLLAVLYRAHIVEAVVAAPSPPVANDGDAGKAAA